MLEAILILNIIILVVVFLMMPTVAGTSQYLNSRKADSRKIREVHDYMYGLKYRDLVKEHEESIAGIITHFEEGGGYYPDGHNTSVTQEEAVNDYVQNAREAMYELDCEKHNYMAFSNGADREWPSGDENQGYSHDWRHQRADWAMHECRDI